MKMLNQDQVLESLLQGTELSQQRLHNRMDKIFGNHIAHEILSVQTFETPLDTRVNKALDILEIFQDKPEELEIDEIRLWFSNELLELTSSIEEELAVCIDGISTISPEINEEEKTVISRCSELGITLPSVHIPSDKSHKTESSKQAAIREWKERKLEQERNKAELANKTRQDEIRSRNISHAMREKQKQLVQNYKSEKAREELENINAKKEVIKEAAKLHMKQLQDLGILDRIKDRESQYLNRRKKVESKTRPQSSKSHQANSAPSKLFHQTASLVERMKIIQSEQHEREERRLLSLLPQFRRLTVYESSS